MLIAGGIGRLLGNNGAPSNADLAENALPRSTATTIPRPPANAPPNPTATVRTSPTLSIPSPTPRPAATRTPKPRPTTPPPVTRTIPAQPATESPSATRTIPPPAQTLTQPAKTPRPANRAPPAIPPTLAPPTPVLLSALQPQSPSSATDCTGYDAWEWAQSVYETDPRAFAGLDPDGDGIACNGLPHGFAPAFWTDALPAGATLGTIARLVDGDTYEILVNGQSARYRLYHADTPEVYETVQCGGSDATEFASYALSFSDTPGQIWIDGIDQRDRYGRKLAYLWFTVDGAPYLLNHVLINNGWAEDIDYGDPYNPYKSHLRAAARFAKEHRLGVWAKCGGFGVALAPPTSTPPSAQAPMGLAGNCNPNYSPCVPNVPYDLDCKDIGVRVQVIGGDPYRLDGDGDGIGCESY